MAKTLQVSPEQLQEIQKLGGEIARISQELNQTSARLWFHSKEAKRSALVLKDVNTLPDDVPMYRAVGRMFICSPSNVIKDDIEKKIQDDTKEIGQLEGKKTYLEKQKVDKEKNLREIINSVQR